MNIGSNLDAVIPDPKRQDTVALAFEPIVGCHIEKHPFLHVIHAAVGIESSLSVMGLYNNNAESSSLNKPAYTDFWNNGKRRAAIVPVIPFKILIDAIPNNVTIHYVKTDMQGFDYAALKSLGKERIR